MKLMSGFSKNWLCRLATLIPYFAGAVLITSVIQLSVYNSISFNRSDAIINPDLPFWEQPTLLNVTDFHWIMTNESTCKIDQPPPDGATSSPRIVLVLVHTARPNFHERQVIRKSYGSMPLYKNWTLRFAFLLGEPGPDQDPKYLKIERKKLLKEQNKFGDVVIGSFIDSYHNLTYKHMMGYKWALSFCKNADFVMKVDDDMFIDILRWLDWRSQDLKKFAGNSSEKIPELYGFNMGGGEPIRNNGSKWYASEEDFPEKNYPAFCSGWGYGITVGLIERLYFATKTVKYFWIDDVFSTGLLLREVEKDEGNDNKPVTNYLGDKRTTDTQDYKGMCEKKAFYRKRRFKSVCYVARGDLFERDMMCLWKKTLQDNRYFKDINFDY